MKKRRNDAVSSSSSSSKCIVLMVFFTAMVAVAAGFVFKVGDDMGWQVPPADNSQFYDYWAAINRFQIGDSLSFEYKNDSVVMVEKWEYYHCNSSDPILAFNNGKGVIILDRPGAFYFISGFPRHCKNGQRLLVEVISPHSISPPPSAPPESYPDSAPSPSSSNAGSSLPVAGPMILLLVTAAFLGFWLC